MSRIFNDYHVVLSKSFLKSKKIMSVYNKRISDLSDDEITQVCHRYCEDNNLVQEFNDLQDSILAGYCYCELIDCGFDNKGAYISKDLCADIQLCNAELKTKKELSERENIDWENAYNMCLNCMHSADF